MPNPPQFDEKSFLSHTLAMSETKAELAGFHLWTGDLEDARQFAEEALKEDPKQGLAHEVMGFLEFGEGRDAEALNEFTQAWTFDPNLSLALFAKTMLSPIAMSNDPTDENSFHDALVKVLGLNPQFAPAYVQLAMLALRRDDPQTALGVSRKAEQLEPTRAGYHILSGQILRRLGRGKEAATFARFVAERWPGPDHDEAVELWNAIPAEQRPAGDPLPDPVPKDMLSMDGHVTAIHCGKKDAQPVLTLTREGKPFSFRMKRPFLSGFSDTIWYGADHFSTCHHLDGMRAIVRYKPSIDPAYVGDVEEIEIRDETPQPPAKTASAQAK
jgi:Tfp pilus assembly protein PilF